ncbi:MAG: phosphatidate cytidylyltransferase [Actinomycetota bacterium]|nr:hypothetical protein [Actinomycetota bacterium]
MSTDRNWASGIYAVKPWFVRRLARVEDALVARKVDADRVTLWSVAVSAGAGGALAAGGALDEPLLWLAVPPLVVARLALNALDGSLARRTGMARPFGTVVNEVCDRASDVCVLAALAWVVTPALALAALAGALFTSLTGVLSLALTGRRATGGPMGKADRALVLAAAAAIAAVTGGSSAFTVALWTILAGCAVTSWLRITSLKASEVSHVPVRR